MISMPIHPGKMDSTVATPGHNETLEGRRLHPVHLRPQIAVLRGPQKRMAYHQDRLHQAIPTGWDKVIEATACAMMGGDDLCHGIEAERRK